MNKKIRCVILLGVVILFLANASLILADAYFSWPRRGGFVPRAVNALKRVARFASNLQPPKQTDRPATCDSNDMIPNIGTVSVEVIPYLTRTIVPWDKRNPQTTTVPENIRVDIRSGFTWTYTPRFSDYSKYPTYEHEVRLKNKQFTTQFNAKTDIWSSTLPEKYLDVGNQFDNDANFTVGSLKPTSILSGDDYSVFFRVGKGPGGNYSSVNVYEQLGWYAGFLPSAWTSYGDKWCSSTSFEVQVSEESKLGFFVTGIDTTSKGSGSWSK